MEHPGSALKRLRLYNRKAEELSVLSFTKKAFHEEAGLTVGFAGSNVRIEKVGADRESTAAFTLTLRLFLQPRDGIEVHQIQELYQDLDIPDEDKHWVALNLKDLDAYLAGGDVVQIAVNGVPLTNRMILETFLYGDLAHVNEDKRSTFENWKAGPYYLVLESRFELIVGEVIRFIFWLARMNEETIKRLDPPRA